MWGSGLSRWNAELSALGFKLELFRGEPLWPTRWTNTFKCKTASGICIPACSHQQHRKAEVTHISCRAESHMCTWNLWSRVESVTRAQKAATLNRNIYSWYSKTNTAEHVLCKKVSRCFCCIFAYFSPFVTVSQLDSPGWEFPSPALTDSWERALLRDSLLAVMFSVWLENFFRPGPGESCWETSLRFLLNKVEQCCQQSDGKKTHPIWKNPGFCSRKICWFSKILNYQTSRKVELFLFINFIVLLLNDFPSSNSPPRDVRSFQCENFPELDFSFYSKCVSAQK